MQDERRGQFRRKLAWAARGLAVATAASLIATVVLWQVYLKPATVNLEALDRAEEQKYGAPSAEAVQHWFQEQRHVEMVAPKQFEYAYLAEYDLTMLQGKPVPKLVFQHVDNNGITRARVFVLKPEQFDLQQLPDEVQGYSERIDILKESPQTAFVIVSSGETLKPLLVHTEDQ